MIIETVARENVRAQASGRAVSYTTLVCEFGRRTVLTNRLASFHSEAARQCNHFLQPRGPCY